MDRDNHATGDTEDTEVTRDAERMEDMGVTGDTRGIVRMGYKGVGDLLRLVYHYHRIHSSSRLHYSHESN